MSFPTNQDSNYKLYNLWTLDNALDIHVCNNILRNRFRKTRDAQPKEELFARKTSYPIEAFGIVEVQVYTPNGLAKIELTNVALAFGFITNLVSLYLLNIKGVYWNLENLQHITCNRKILCNLEKVDSH